MGYAPNYGINCSFSVLSFGLVSRAVATGGSLFRGASSGLPPGTRTRSILAGGLALASLNKKAALTAASGESTSKLIWRSR